MKAEAGNVTNTSYVVEAINKVFLIELVSGEDTSAEIKKKLEEMAATFLLTDSVDETDKVSAETIEGEFCGWADDHTVEVIINGEPSAYMVLDEKVKQVLENFDEGTIFTFEVETYGEVKKIINIHGE